MTPLLAQAVPTIGPDTIPGSVAIPTWVLVAAIVALFAVRELERRRWFEKVEAATKAIEGLTATVEKLTDRLGSAKP